MTMTFGPAPAGGTHFGKVGLLAVFEVPHRRDVGNGQRLAPRLHQPNKIDPFSRSNNLQAFDIAVGVIVDVAVIALRPAKTAEQL